MTDSLLGVVEPPDGAFPVEDAGPPAAFRDDEEALEAQALERQDRELRDTLFTSVFDEVQARNEQALAEVQERLAARRDLVRETYAEIKDLVEEELFLRRMVAVGRKRRR